MAETPPTRKASLVFVLWTAAMLLAIYLWLPSILTAWPADWMERRAQRRKTVERVESNGGWIALERDCGALVEQNRDGGFMWHRGLTNALPPAIAALQPLDVRFYPPSPRDAKASPAVPVVRIKIFGIHSTGGHSTPYFGLEVISGNNPDSYHARPSEGGASGNRSDSYRRVTSNIFEIY